MSGDQQAGCRNPEEGAYTVLRRWWRQLTERVAAVVETTATAGRPASPVASAAAAGEVVAGESVRGEAWNRATS